jgi:cysteine desulfuration protein SufE
VGESVPFCDFEDDDTAMVAPNQVQPMTIDELIEEFDDLGDWEAQCDLLIDLGFELPPFPADEKTEANRVHGCQSMVWLIANVTQDGEPTIELLADSDAMIVKGLITVLLAAFSGRGPQEILDTDIEGIFTRLGLDRHLSSARKNGLYGMVKRIRAIATSYA